MHVVWNFDFKVFLLEKWHRAYVCYVQKREVYRVQAFPLATLCAPNLLVLEVLK